MPRCCRPDMDIDELFTLTSKEPQLAPQTKPWFERGAIVGGFPMSRPRLQLLSPRPSYVRRLLAEADPPDTFDVDSEQSQAISASMLCSATRLV